MSLWPWKVKVKVTRSSSRSRTKIALDAIKTHLQPFWAISSDDLASQVSRSHLKVSNKAYFATICYSRSIGGLLGLNIWHVTSWHWKVNLKVTTSSSRSHTKIAPDAIRTHLQPFWAIYNDDLDSRGSRSHLKVPNKAYCATVCYFKSIGGLAVLFWRPKVYIYLSLIHISEPTRPY